MTAAHQTVALQTVTVQAADPRIVTTVVHRIVATVEAHQVQAVEAHQVQTVEAHHAQTVEVEVERDPKRNVRSLFELFR